MAITQQPNEIIAEFLRAKHSGANWIQKLVEEAYLAGRVKGLHEAYLMMPSQVIWYPPGFHIDANAHGDVLNSARQEVFQHMLRLEKEGKS